MDKLRFLKDPEMSEEINNVWGQFSGLSLKSASPRTGHVLSSLSDQV